MKCQVDNLTLSFEGPCVFVLIVLFFYLFFLLFFFALIFFLFFVIVLFLRIICAVWLGICLFFLTSICPLSKCGFVNMFSLPNTLLQWQYWSILCYTYSLICKICIQSDVSYSSYCYWFYIRATQHADHFHLDHIWTHKLAWPKNAMIVCISDFN